MSTYCYYAYSALLMRHHSIRASMTLTTECSIYTCAFITNQPDTKSNLNPNHNRTSKQPTVVCIQLNIVTCPNIVMCPTYPEAYDNVAPCLQLSVVIVTLPVLGSPVAQLCREASLPQPVYTWYSVQINENFAFYFNIYRWKTIMDRSCHLSYHIISCHIRKIMAP